MSWKLSAPILSSNSNIVALLKYDEVSLYALLNNIDNVTVLPDTFPHWRKLAVSKCASIFALAYSNGQIDIFVSKNMRFKQIFRVLPYPKNNITEYSLFSRWFSRVQDATTNNIPSSSLTREPLAALLIINSTLSDNEFMLVTLSYNCWLRIYRLQTSSSDLVAIHYNDWKTTDIALIYEDSLSYFHSVTLDMKVTSKNILIVTGKAKIDPLLDPVTSAVSFHEITNNAKHLVIHKMSSGIAKPLTIIQKTISMFTIYVMTRDQFTESVMHKITVSPDESKFAIVDFQGNVHLFSIGDRKFLQTIDINKMPQRKDAAIRNIDFWDNSSLIVLFDNGSFCIVPTSEPALNLLGALEHLTQDSQVIKPKLSDAIHILECEYQYIFLPTLPNGQYDYNRIRPLTLEEVEAMAEEERVKNEQSSKIVTSLKHLLSSFSWLNDTLLWHFDDTTRIGGVKNAIRLPIYRYSLFKKTTPENLLRIKLENEEYIEALRLAEIYELDTDVVYQAQWNSSPVSKTTIDQYLKLIKDRKFVIRSCISRIPSLPSSTRLLLNFGIEFIEHNGSVEFSAELACLKRYLDKLDLFDSFAENNVKTFALRFNHYNINDFPKTFEGFREQTLFEIAVNLALAADFLGLKLIFEKTLLDEQYLEVLSSIPETVSPDEYESLIYPDMISEKWIVSRVLEIDDNAGNIDGALRLVELVLKMDSFQDSDVLKSLYKKLLDYYRLVYSCSNFDDQFLELSFRKFQSLPSKDIIDLFLSNCTSQNFKEKYYQLILPFLSNDSTVNVDHGPFLNYVVSIANERLDIAYYLFEFSKPTVPQAERLIKQEDLLIQTALNCIYATNSPSQLQVCLSICGCLPERDKDSADGKLKKLHDEVDDLENHIMAGEILSKYRGMFVPLRDLKENRKDKKFHQNLLVKFCKSLRDFDNDTIWTTALKDLFVLKEIYLDVEHNAIYESFIEQALFEKSMFAIMLLM
jgi:hypothetical protein